MVGKREVASEEIACTPDSYTALLLGPVIQGHLFEEMKGPGEHCMLHNLLYPLKCWNVSFDQDKSIWLSWQEVYFTSAEEKILSSRDLKIDKITEGR